MKQSLWNDPPFSAVVLPVTAAAIHHCCAQPPAIGAKAIIPIYAKTSAALATAAYRPARKKICSHMFRAFFAYLKNEPGVTAIE